MGETVMEIGAYHASERAFPRLEQDLLHLIRTAPDERERQACERRLVKLRARERMKVRIVEDDKPSTTRRQNKKDPLTEFPDRLLKIAEMLRGHFDGDTLRSCGDDVGFHDKGQSELTGPEAFANGAFRGRTAWERFMKGCGERDVAQQCMLVMVNRKTWTKALESLAWSVKGDNREKLKVAMANGLDEAGAYLFGQGV